ncbi:MAG TPA: peptidase M50 [Bradyrhizobium sp.]|nr:peptidase M50 [Bradyrhizobium sp.]
MGSEPFLSSSWYRVARLRPKLRDHARIRRHRYRGRIWYVLDDRLSSRVHRLSPSAYIFVALMDGRRTVDDLWSNVVRQNGESAPTQDEIVHLLAQLHASDLLQSDISPDSLEVFDRFVTQKRTRLKQMLLNPMSLRLPIFDPDPFLERTLPLVRPLLGWFGGLLWFAVVIPALVLAAGRWSELSENVTDRLLATENLLLLSLVFPVVKLLHELGHGYATKVFGGAVHEFGIMLIMGMPTPYVDASSSSGFRNKSRRALVGAAGMIVEVFVAALALHVWRIAEPGAVRTLCFNVITVAGVSTLIFNGNPLMRYDGYYILIDVLEIPNLASRSAQLWRAMVDKYAFRVADARIPAGAPGELKWLVSYAPAAFMYRMSIQFGIALFLAGRFFFIGVFLASWTVVTGVLIPVFNSLKYVATSRTLQKHRARAVGLTAGLAAAAVIMLAIFPFPLHTVSEGVVWLPDNAILRAGTDGFVRRLLVPPDTIVRAGDALIETQEPQLEANVETLTWRVEELQSALDAARFRDRPGAEVAAIDLASAKSELARQDERARHLVARSEADGTFVLAKSEDMPGRFFRQGEVLGYVTPASSNIVRVVVPQDDIELVRNSLRGVSVKLSGRVWETNSARLVREVPAASSQLPSKALSTAGGGSFAVDPGDRESRKTLQRYFQFDIELPPEAAAIAFGSRVYVRFEHESEPLGFQLFRRLRQLFLARLNV